MAIIEISEIRRPFDQNQSIYGSIKNACNQTNVISQGIRQLKLLVPAENDSKGQLAYKNRENRKTQSRAYNALLDLIIRSPGGFFGDIPEVYHHAGLNTQLAEQLCVVGLYNLNTSSYRVNYPVAIELRANGQVKVRLPGNEQRWQHPLDAAIALGKTFLEGKPKLSAAEIAEFGAQIMTESRSEPTLILLDAIPWRNHNILPQFSNRSSAIPNAGKNVLDFSAVINVNQLFMPHDLAHLRVIRMRRSGTSGETPQYVATLDQDWDNIDEATDLGNLTGYVDTQADSMFVHYLSVGQKPVGAKNQKDGVYKDDEGGGIAFKHQTIVEFVPFLLQEGDSELIWCRIPHLLRLSPAWDGGNTVLPYPTHLAMKLLKDQLSLVGETAEVEDDN